MSSRDCFVYIVLPGEAKFVTAGRYRRSIDRHGIATGRFVYGKSYLARDNAVPIDSIELKLGTKTYETNLLKGIFGSLRDASPDHWGAGVSLSGVLDRRTPMRWTTCCIHQTTAPALWVLA